MRSPRKLVQVEKSSKDFSIKLWKQERPETISGAKEKLRERWLENKRINYF